MKPYFLLLASLIIIIPMPFSSAQDIPIQKEFQEAVEKGTRTMKGHPGSAYWINHSDYMLQAEVVFENDTVWIEGKADITYYNESPDELNMIVIRSYPDMMADAAIRNYYIFPDNETRQVSYSDLIIDNDTIPAALLMRSRTSTNLMVRLDQALAPGGKANMRLSWKYFLHPNIDIRQGHYENDAIFIAYWYPQVAVYDDIYGWDMTDYMGIVEFYNDFNNYDVSLTLPAAYLVWAGGVLQNPGEVYPDPLRKKVENALQSDEIVNIIKADDLPADHGNKEKITWKFKAEGTPDFSFAASKTHLWDASGLEVEKGRRVLVSAVYPESSHHYHKGAQFARNAVEYLSFTCPGAPYPWPSMTVFNSGEGGGGMETPMMVNNGDQNSEISADEVIFHEIAHSYLPFYTGTNERRFAWMDEGWATYQGIKWSEADRRSTAGSFGQVFNMVSGTAKDLPLMIPTYSIFDGVASSFNSYVRAAQAFMAIENQLGTEEMNRAWKLFTDRWHHKHPAPWDLFAIFEEVAGEDLDWLLIPWYYEFKSQELELSSVDTDAGKIKVTNIGSLPLPVYLKLEYDDGKSVKIHRKPEIFRDSMEAIIDIDNAEKLRSVSLGNPYFFDRNESNNSWKRSGE
ncbi:MAG: M1 family metallopeptidase [Bacteroidales bacterium]|nr:M1 family metallopeptidase [Bacteroidales bacterium]